MLALVKNLALDDCRDAWHSLGDMPRDDAMLGYVDELKKVLTARYPTGYDKQEVILNEKTLYMYTCRSITTCRYC